MINKIYISTRTNLLKLKAANKHNIRPEDCHIGFIILQALLDDPHHIHQVDVATDGKETNASVAARTTRLADALVKAGVQPGDKTVVIGSNHLDITVPFYASHCIGSSLCSIDNAVEPRDLEAILAILKPKMVFCQKIHKSHVEEAFKKFDFNGNVVTFDGDDNMEAFIATHRGSDENFSPPIFDQSTIAWMMLTSGTTGLPKVAMIPYNTLLNGIICWWEKFDDKITHLLAMATIQWMSSLMFFISAPIMQYTRLQSSVPMTPQLLITTINKHKPQATAWIPHMLGRFLEAAGDLCDLSCFKAVVLGGSGIDKELFSTFKAKCKNAYLFLVYGMTELLVPVFDFDALTPFGSAGQPKSLYDFKLVDDEGHSLNKPFSSGELWIKGGDSFFKGYFENPKETSTMLTDDGWLKTGDIFYKDDEDYYYFVERKRLLIRHQSIWISPLQLEDVIIKHPGVAEACVVGIPDPENMELPIGAIACRAGQVVDPEDIFKLIKENMPETKQLFGGLFFMDSLPTTASGKINRSKVKELAHTAQRTLPKAT